MFVLLACGVFLFRNSRGLVQMFVLLACDVFLCLCLLKVWSLGLRSDSTCIDQVP